jgi:polysaccharide export outer membrane protein
MKSLNKFVPWRVVLAFLVLALICISCATTSSDLDSAGATAAAATGAAGGASPEVDVTSEIIHPGDSLIIVFSDLPTTQPSFEVKVSDEGTITLIENQKFVAAGKSRVQLEKEIRDRYVPQYYVRMTVTIKPQERLFFVRGEVKSPGRLQYIGPTTVLKAIASAGDFTDYANRKKVTLIHLNGKKEVINCTKAIEDPQQYDRPVYPGDTIHVRRKLL